MSTLKVPISADEHIQGVVDAPVVLVEYGDYQCPYCALAHPLIKMLQKKFGKQLCFVFRNFPLSEVHPLAEPAAEAAEFAAEYNKFNQMHDLIYEHQDRLSLPFLVQLAETLGLPRKDLELAIVNKKYEQKIRKDFLGGVRSGVNGTPSFFINGDRYNGPSDFNELVIAIDSVLHK